MESQSISNTFIVTTAIDGDNAIVYYVDLSTNVVTIAGDATSANWNGNIRFYKREGNEEPVRHSFYTGIAAKLSDDTYSWIVSPLDSKVTGYSEPYTIPVLSTYTSVIVCCWDTIPATVGNVGSCVASAVARGEIAVMKNGDSGFSIDLTNQSDIIGADVDGYTTEQQTRSTGVHLLKGSEKQVLTGLICTELKYCTSGSAVPTASYTLTPSYTAGSNEGTVTLTVRSGYQLTEAMYTDITATCGTSPNAKQLTARFSIGLQKSGAQGESPTIYQLLPSASEISVKKTANGYSPSMVSVCCGYTATTGDVTVSVTDCSTVFGGKMIYFRRRTRSSATWESKYYKYITSAYHAYLSSFDVSTYDKIEFIIYPDGSNEITASSIQPTSVTDIQTVPVLTGGESAPIAFATPDKISVACNNVGMVLADTSADISFMMKVGTETVNNITVTNPSAISGVTISGSGTSRHIVIAAGTSQTGLVGGATFTVTSGDYSAQCTIAFICGYQGATGSTGHVGRWYYYAGVWNSTDANNGVYKMEATQSPFVKASNEKFYMLDNSGVEPSSLPYVVKYNPTSGGSAWTEMSSEFQYYIAEAFFGQYAHLGSFIINHDWMISQNGGVVLTRTKEVTTTSSEIASFTCKTSGTHTMDFEGQVPTGVNQTLYIIISACRNDTGAVVSQTRLYTYTPTGTITFNGTTGVEYSVTAQVLSETDPQPRSASGYITKGTMTTPCDYLLFNVEDVTAANSCGFVPNFAVNGLSGSVYMNDAVMKGNIYKPFARVNYLTYQEYGEVDLSKDFVLSLPNGVQSAQFESFDNGSEWVVRRWQDDDENYYHNIYLPQATQENLGWELDIVNMTGIYLHIPASGGVNKNPLTNSSGTMLSIPPNQICRLKVVEYPIGNTYAMYRYTWIRLAQQSLSF